MATLPSKKIARLTSKMLPELTAIRHYIHQHPELGFEEVGTAAIVQRELESAGIEVTRIGASGVVGLIRGAGRRTVALRADMDALPMREATGLPYASVNDCMHACGHDGHVACLIGAARVLAQMRSELPGNVKLLFQPAEEARGGSKTMIDGGCMKSPKVDAVFALHGFPDVELGCIAVKSGPVMAATDRLEIDVRGEGAHGAYPHKSHDSVLCAARIIDAVQSIVSRELDPLDPAVVSITTIHAGNAYNIIPERVEILGTIRTYSPAVRRHIISAVDRIAANTAKAHRCTARVRVVEGYPMTVNDEKMADLVAQTGCAVIGASHVQPQQTSLGAEDFSFYLKHAPGAFFRLGIAQAGKPFVPLHNPKFDFNDLAIPTGVKMLSAVAIAYLSQ